MQNLVHHSERKLIKRRREQRKSEGARHGREFEEDAWRI